MLDNSRQYELTIRPLGRRSADEYYHEGSIWIEGREGNTYTIDIKNNTYKRMLFVVSVDGLDVLEGKLAGLNSQGYVLNANQTISIPGWKLNNQEAAEFFFSRSRDSYVNAIGGSTTNTGVIGVMIFSEKLPDYTSLTTLPYNGYLYPNSTIGVLRADLGMNISSSAVSNQVYVSQNLSQDVGTGFGESTTWKTSNTTFEKANSNEPDCILAVYYNTAKNLEKMGIALRRRNDVAHKANPFPTYSSSSPGCKPPRDWQG